MLIDRHPAEDVFARVPELAEQTDPVLRVLDQLLDDDPLFQQIKSDLARRSPQTLRRGRPSTPVEVILRLLALKHLYNWSFADTEERVADSLVLRWFSRVYFQRVPDDTTLVRWAKVVRPPTLQALNDRIVVLSQQAKVTQGRKLRVDGTVSQTPIHYPTDSSLLCDGVRVLSRTLRRSKAVVGEALSGVRDAFRTRMRTMRRGLQAIHRTARQKGEEVAEQRAALYKTMIDAAEATVAQAQQVRQALDDVARQGARGAQHLKEQFDTFVPRVQQAIAQARRRVREGQTVPASAKIVSLFEPHTQIIRRHKSGASVEFGRKVFVGETEGGIVAHYQVLGEGETEQDAVLPAVLHHREVFGHAPHLLTGDRGTHSATVEQEAHAAGVRQVIIPWSGKPPPAQRAREKERGWRRRYRWRAGIEGQIRSLQRDYGLAHCAYHGDDGVERAVGWGVLASNLHHLGQALAL